ncbi:MAG: acyloxyacyl hydrolase [Bacteroidales bacterium]|nr:acyloxyacyl hydrolase [Bacteroidales bacterium]MCF8388072.1 acyloxyacyl hydrolase [Bacteroidales bacterium]MCF8398843.1 acyloxyacyl hydrolase [Bacteroidales bacterium]
MNPCCIRSFYSFVENYLLMNPVRLNIISKALLTGVLLLICMNDSLAQEKFKLIQSNLILETKAHYGFLIPHHREMDILNSHMSCWEFTISKATYGGTRWEYMYDYPVIGLALWYSDLGKSPYLGSGTAFYPYINFPLIRNRQTTLSFRLGVGLGYISKPFDRIENYKNIAIGSHLNAAVNLMFEYSLRMGERFIVSGGMALTHFSNGSMKTPNFGINIPSISAGFAYRLSRENPYQRKKLMPELYPFEFDGKRFFNINLSLGFGFKNMEAEFGKRYFATTFFANVFKRITYKSSIGLGFDLSYDESDKVILEKKNIPFQNELQIIRPGMNIAYEMIMSRFSIVANLGIYLGGKEKSDGDIYEKLAFKYHISRLVFTNVTLKAHAARADYIAFGIGYRINVMYY